MKALSIRHPWTELILQGKKKIEIRTRNTNFRNYFLIHASQIVDKKAVKKYNFDVQKLKIGAIVGYAKLIDVIAYCSSEEFLKDRDKHLSFEAKDKYPVYGFVLDKVHRIIPIKYRGRLGFFEVPEIKFEDLDEIGYI